MAQYWGQGERAGTGDTKRLKTGWGTDITEGSFFLAHPAKTRFSHVVKGRLELGAALSFSVDGAPRWRLLSTSS